ncbi:hypothetical protein OH492_21955 [Vibrio chagasii]|nr:hypothetical protein [Vibrio chagasii]
MEHSFYQGRAGQEWLDALKPLGTNAYSKPYLEKHHGSLRCLQKKKGGMTNDGEQSQWLHTQKNEFCQGIATGFCSRYNNAARVL